MCCRYTTPPRSTRAPRSTGCSPTPISEKSALPRKVRLTATLPDGTVKTIGPTAVAFTHYWRIVAELANGKTEVFWGHTKSLGEASKKRAATADAARHRGWNSYTFEIVELERSE